MSSASPESATHRNGPLPSQNRGEYRREQNRDNRMRWPRPGQAQPAGYCCRNPLWAHPFRGTPAEREHAPHNCSRPARTGLYDGTDPDGLRSTRRRSTRSAISIDEIMSGRLVRDQTGPSPSALARLAISGRISAALPSRPTDNASFSFTMSLHPVERVVQIRCLGIQIPRSKSKIDTRLLAFNCQRGGAREGCG